MMMDQILSMNGLSQKITHVEGQMDGPSFVLLMDQVLASPVQLPDKGQHCLVPIPMQLQYLAVQVTGPMPQQVFLRHHHLNQRAFFSSSKIRNRNECVPVRLSSHGQVEKVHVVCYIKIKVSPFSYLSMAFQPFSCNYSCLHHLPLQ